MIRDRFLTTPGIHNFRDYGGYRAADGRQVKRGVLFRSGQHRDAGEADLQAVDALALAHVIDFRGASERRNAPCPRSDDFSAQVHFYEGETAGLAPHLEAAEGSLDEESAHQAMERLYRNLPNREPVLWVMRRYFDLLSKGEGASLVHCLAGKDRTGMAVALLHHALGVHPDDAMEDFLLTNEAPNNEARIAAGFDAVRERWNAASEEVVRILMGVDARYLHAMRESVEAEHGSIDAFLKDVLGVDQAKRDALRLHLTEA